MPYADREKKLSYLRKYSKELKTERIKEGLCFKCGAPRDGVTLLCTKCNSRAKLLAKKRYNPSNPRLLEYRRNYYKSWRLKALGKICLDKGLQMKCPCGCDDTSLLEINHLNGNGSTERRTFTGADWFRKIATGIRSTEDLDIRCQVCNWAYFASLKSGRKWEIKYIG